MDRTTLGRKFCAAADYKIYIVVEILVLVSSWLLCLEEKNGSTSTGRGNVAPSRKIVYYPPSFVCWIVSVNRNVSLDSLVLVPGDGIVRHFVQGAFA